MKKIINQLLNESENQMKSKKEYPFAPLNKNQFLFRAKEESFNGTNLIEPGDIVLVDKKAKIKGYSFLYLKTEDNQEFIDCYPIKVEGEIKEYYPITSVYKETIYE